MESEITANKEVPESARSLTVGEIFSMYVGLAVAEVEADGETSKAKEVSALMAAWSSSCKTEEVMQSMSGIMKYVRKFNAKVTNYHYMHLIAAQYALRLPAFRELEKAIKEADELLSAGKKEEADGLVLAQKASQEKMQQVVEDAVKKMLEDQTYKMMLKEFMKRKPQLLNRMLGQEDVQKSDPAINEFVEGILKKLREDKQRFLLRRVGGMRGWFGDLWARIRGDARTLNDFLDGRTLEKIVEEFMVP